METTAWFNYVVRRYRAHLNIIRILNNQGIRVVGNAFAWFYPETLQEFRTYWGDTSLKNSSSQEQTHLIGSNILQSQHPSTKILVNRKAYLMRDTMATIINLGDS